MVLPGHIAGGFLATHAILTFSQVSFSSGETLALYIIGTAAGDGPDLDLIWHSFKHIILKSKENDNHREYISHAPLLWVFITSLIALIGYVMGSLFVQYTGLVILAGSITHFLFDSIEYGIMWLWPFSRRKFCIKEVVEPDLPGTKGGVTYYWNFITRVYPFRLTAYFEIAVVLLAMYVAYKFWS